MSHVLVSAEDILRSIKNIRKDDAKLIKRSKKRDMAAYYASLRWKWKWGARFFRRPPPTPEYARKTYIKTWRGDWILPDWCYIGSGYEDTLRDLENLAKAIPESERHMDKVTLSSDHAWILKWRNAK